MIRDLSYVGTLTSLLEIEGVCMAVDCRIIPRLSPQELDALEFRAREIGGKSAAPIVTELRRRGA
jgi:hypothetical protein